MSDVSWQPNLMGEADRFACLTLSTDRASITY